MYVFVTLDFYEGKYVFVKNVYKGHILTTKNFNEAFTMEAYFSDIRRFSSLLGINFVAKPCHFFKSMECYKVFEQLEFLL